jgi:hypothetical protein
MRGGEYRGVLFLNLERRFRRFFPNRVGVYFLVPVPPSPLIECKIKKTNDLICDYLVDL